MRNPKLSFLTPFHMLTMNPQSFVLLLRLGQSNFILDMSVVQPGALPQNFRSVAVLSQEVGIHVRCNVLNWIWCSCKAAGTWKYSYNGQHLTVYPKASYDFTHHWMQKWKYAALARPGSPTMLSQGTLLNFSGTKIIGIHIFFNKQKESCCSWPRHSICSKFKVVTRINSWLYGESEIRGRTQNIMQLMDSEMRLLQGLNIC